MPPTPTDPTTPPSVGQREPVLVIVGATVVLLNALLAVVFAFVTFSPGQVAALYGVSNPLAVFVAAVVTRGRVAPWDVTDLPSHAHDLGYDPDPHA